MSISVVVLTTEIRKKARKLYSPNLPYHNFEHALHVLMIARRMVRRCKTENVPINETVVIYAALFHDAGYHIDSKSKGFNTKEEYSANLAKQALQGQNIGSLIASQVYNTILATHRDAPFLTNEEKLLRAADLSGLAGKYKDFIANTKKLKEEFEIIHNKKISWAEWKKSTAKLINFYLRQDIRLTLHYQTQNGGSHFHSQARANLRRFLEERFED